MCVCSFIVFVMFISQYIFLHFLHIACHFWNRNKKCTVYVYFSRENASYLIQYCSLFRFSVSFFLRLSSVHWKLVWERENRGEKKTKWPTPKSTLFYLYKTSSFMCCSVICILYCILHSKRNFVLMHQRTFFLR